MVGVPYSFLTFSGLSSWDDCPGCPIGIGTAVVAVVLRAAEAAGDVGAVEEPVK